MKNHSLKNQFAYKPEKQTRFKFVFWIMNWQGCYFNDELQNLLGRKGIVKEKWYQTVLNREENFIQDYRSDGERLNSTPLKQRETEIIRVRVNQWKSTGGHWGMSLVNGMCLVH